MIDFAPFDVEIVEHRTVWFTDDAVDIEASNLEEWAKTGKGYQILPQQQASVIRWKALSPRERLEATAMAGMIRLSDDTIPSVAIAKYHWECARFGLVSISGRNMSKDEKHGVPCIAYDEMRKLDTIVVPRDLPEPMNQLGGLRLVTWIGGLISEASFCEAG